MSDFWKLKIVAKEKLRVKIQVWAIYEDCQRFQFTKNWLLLSLYLANRKVCDFLDDVYIKLQMQADEDLERGDAYCMDDLDDEYPEVIDKIMGDFDISELKNVPAPPEFYAAIYHYHQSEADFLPSCIYTIEFKDADFVQLLRKNMVWQSPCFDLNPTAAELNFWAARLDFGINPNYQNNQ